jgi:hypothetical protein
MLIVLVRGQLVTKTANAIIQLLPLQKVKEPNVRSEMGMRKPVLPELGFVLQILTVWDHGPSAMQIVYQLILFLGRFRATV